MNKLPPILGSIFILLIASADFVNSQGLQSRIVGGYQVLYNQYPYFSLLKVSMNEEGEEFQINCGGSLIAKNVILTAAHCLGDSVTDIQVELNIISKGLTKNVVSASVTGWEIHSEYSFRENNVRNDIGLVYLEDTPRNIQPIKINFDGRPDPYDPITVIGFGTKGDGRLSDTLQAVVIDTLENKICRTIFKEVLNTDLQFCTGMRDSDKAACKGDSGGPAIMRYDGEDEDVQVGLVSFGAPDCKTGMTGYTRVSGYENWLKERVCEREFPPDWCDRESLSNLLSSLSSGTPAENEENVIGLTGCFSGSSTVQVKGAGEIQMEDLKIGDMVNVGDNIYEPIYSFGHRAQAERVNMMQISTEASRLRLTPDHMVFTHNEGAVQASQIKVGDHVLDGNARRVKVLSVKNVTGYGLFNPFTPSGRIVVDKILSSNYIAFEDKNTWQIGSLTLNYHLMAHVAIAPLRIVCYHFGSCEDETYSADGILECLKIPLNFVQWVFAQNGINRGISILLISFILIIQYAIEKLILNLFVLLPILCISIIFWSSKYAHLIRVRKFRVRERIKIKLLKRD